MSGSYRSARRAARPVRCQPGARAELAGRSGAADGTALAEAGALRGQPLGLAGTLGMPSAKISARPPPACLALIIAA